MKPTLALAIIAALFAWEFARALWETCVLGKSAAEQAGEDI